MAVRVLGNGFTPNGSVDLWQCGEFVGKLCARVGRIPTDASGNLRGYRWFTAQTPTAAHFPVAGDLSFTTTYRRQTYIDMTNWAASYDYTLDELQKSGTLFWSWLLAGQPPLPAE